MSDYSYVGILFSTLKDALITNAIIHKDFLTLKGYMAISVFYWVNQLYIFLWLAQYICQVTYHIISSPVDFVVSPVENLLLGLNRENFVNFKFSPIR